MKTRWIYYAIYHYMREITTWRQTEFASLLIRRLHLTAECPLIFTPSLLFLFSPLLIWASSLPAAIEGHGYADRTLYVREPGIVIINEFMAARIRPLGSTCIRKRTGKIPEELSSKPSAASAETTAERFPQCFPGKLQGTCVSAGAYELHVRNIS